MLSHNSISSQTNVVVGSVSLPSAASFLALCHQKQLGRCSHSPSITVAPCRLVRALLQVYFDRPGA